MHLLLFALLSFTSTARSDEGPLIRSARSGAWSNPATWAGESVPSAGARVQIRSGDSVVYDVTSETPIRSIHVAGSLKFVPDKDTLLTVGLIKIQPGQDASENGFDCDAHASLVDSIQPRPALEVGTQSRPIEAGHTAIIRLASVQGLDKTTCPAIVCCGGSMDFHGAPLSRSWVKLGATAKTGDTEVKLGESVTGWRVGDRVILTSTSRQIKLKKTFTASVKDNPGTEERIIKSISGDRITLGSPVAYDHLGDGAYRGEIANLSRNVIVESAEPNGVRGHTMYHRNSAGSISYAEFRHLGKEGILGKYSLHFHLAGDTMRGSSVIGSSIWDSGNRWLTIHGTNYLVVRDCVGYRSVGHGFFMEDGTEVFNVLDRNLAVQALYGKPLPKQVMPFDKNDAAGFWWANCLNSFTRNVCCESDEYGYWFAAQKTADFDTDLPIQQPDGSSRVTDIRTLPFLRFEGNESHTQRRHAFNMGGGRAEELATADGRGVGVQGVGPDDMHPFVIRHMTCWDVHWAVHPAAPGTVFDDLDIHAADYGLWRAVYERQAYRNVKMTETREKELQPTGKRPKEDEFPGALKPVDDMPPVTVITHIRREGDKLIVRGTCSDNGEIKRVLVKGKEARSLREGFAEWEGEVDAPANENITITAFGEDAAGNVEKRPHVVIYRSR